jgi:glucan phosphoethanolaminetransferase (alkaline phosphatase superfamily)
MQPQQGLVFGTVLIALWLFVNWLNRLIPLEKYGLKVSAIFLILVNVASSVRGLPFSPGGG